MVATFNGSPSANADDGYYVDAFGDSFDNTGTAVLVNVADFFLETPNAIGFVRVPNVTIPNGAKISAAAFDLVSTIKVNTTGRNINIAACAEDNSSQMSDQYDAAGRTLTTNATGDFGNLTAGGSFTTFDFTTAVQEIVDRPGWVSGNAMQFIFYESGGAGGTAIGFAALDHATYAAPVLDITYTAGSAPAPFLPAFADLF